MSAIAFASLNVAVLSFNHNNLYYFKMAMRNEIWKCQDNCMLFWHFFYLIPSARNYSKASGKADKICVKEG
ncbi:hypothetical protein BTR25_07560 [Bacillus sp. MRMR6]|nr:hypothetical protein BTR25_07560 [Bacillus sp. MRMR6]